MGSSRRATGLEVASEGEKEVAEEDRMGEVVGAYQEGQRMRRYDGQSIA